MSPDIDRPAFPRSQTVGAFKLSLMTALLFPLALLLGATGCDELDARMEIQEAGKLYQKGRFSEACPKYDKVLEISDAREVQEVAHYNGGICYHKMFRPGVDTPENKAIAAKATAHFAGYLELHPHDRTIVSMMSQVWMDSGDFQSALDYWGREHAKNPKDQEVILILAGIYRQSGDWEKAIEWHRKEVEVMDSPAGKAGGYMNVAKIASSKLFNRESIYWEERVRIADLGIEALQRAEELTPDNPDIAQYLGTMFNLRAEAHQAAWARVIDGTTGRFYFGRFVKLRDAQDPTKAQPKPGTGGTGEQPKDGSTGAGADGTTPEGQAPAGGETGTEGAGDKGEGAAEGGTEQPAATPAAP